MKAIRNESDTNDDNQFNALENAGSRCGNDEDIPIEVMTAESLLSASTTNTGITNSCENVIVINCSMSPPNDVKDHDSYRIALYYCYIPLSQNDIMALVNFHSTKSTTLRQTIHNQSITNGGDQCDSVDVLGGRIRIAPEGLNGVLSGTLVELQLYEKQLRHILLHIHNHHCDDNDSRSSRSIPVYDEFELDVKYCHLRTDLSISSQLFTKMQVQMTDTVVGLFDKDMIMNSQNHNVEYEVEIEIDDNGTHSACDHAVEIASPHRRRRNGKYRKQQQSSEHDQRQREHLDSIRTIYKTSFQPKCEQQELLPPLLKMGGSAPHLSPDEWNEKLQQLLLQNQQVNNELSTTITTTTNYHNIVLLDCRNCYESAIGYFEVPGATTILTNTRKYSELPYVIMDQVSDTGRSATKKSTNDEGERSSTTSALRNASHIFMYCTGGVRCERASAFLQAALMSVSSSSQPQSPLPEIYQLHGGIQRYLEKYSHGDESKNEKSDSGSTSTYYYKGKNFVFDLRRTDPMTIGDPSNSNTVVGQCVICTTPYDDYDHGYAPMLQYETRCYKCRILILVCPHCRKNVVCWGDDAVQKTNDVSSTAKKKKLYCGGLEPKQCLYIPPVKEINAKSF